MKKAKTIIFIIITAAALAASAAAIWYFSDNSEEKPPSSPEPKTSSGTEVLQSENTQSLKTEEKINFSKTYQNPDFNFSFKYPSGFSIRLITSDDDGYTYLLSSGGSRTATSIKQSIQIFIRPIATTEPVNITKTDIKASNPDLKISSSQPIIIGDKSGSGLAFTVGDKGDNQTREIWFAYAGQLYQISTFLANDALLRDIMNTWQFK